MGQQIDNLSRIFTDTIEHGWEQHGIYKCVNSMSRPWFTPSVKTYSREARYWEGQIKRCKTKPEGNVFLHGKIYSLDDCKMRRDEANKRRIDTLNQAEQNSRDYISKQLAAGNFKVIKRIFQTNHASIPT